MTFTITQEDAVPIPPKIAIGAPAAFGLDTLEVGKMAFVPVSAHPNAAKYAITNMSKGVNTLGTYVHTHFKVHRDLKGRVITVRRYGDGIRIWRTA